MIWSSIFLLLLVFIKNNYSYDYNECKILTAICWHDPNCPNVELFRKLCAEKYQQYSADRSWIYLPNTRPQKQQSRTAENQGISYYSNDNYLQGHQHSAGNSEDYQIKHTKRSQFKNVEELLNVYNLYKRHSLEETLKDIKEKLSRDIGINSSNDYKGHSEGTNKKDVITDDSTDQLDIVKKAIALLKKVNSLHLSPEKKALNKKIITAEVQVKEEKKKKKRKDTYQEIGYSPQDIEEIAQPIYSSLTEKEDLVKKENFKDPAGNKNLVIKLSKRVDSEKASKIGDTLQKLLAHTTVSLQKVDKDQVYFHIISDKSSADSVAEKINQDSNFRKEVESESGENILQASTSKGSETIRAPIKPVDKSVFKAHITVFAAVVSACTVALIVAAIIVCLVKRKQDHSNFLGFKKQEAVEDYKELCRTQMSVTNSRGDEEEDETDKNNAMRHNWYEDQFPYNMDISTGHVILAYMEDHLKNENRLNKEWEALCNYKADDAETNAGIDSKNATRNRYGDVLPFDRTRVKLRDVINVYHSDYINANYITDVDPQNPDYIATQGPLEKTVADFWQMVWEQGVVVIVNLTKLSDMGLPQCHRYWPEDGSEIYHIYEVHLISEHIWCDDYLVRSLYLKNLRTGETRTITQFHYLTWPDLSIPDSARPLLEFRRKVNKCYRGQSCPIIVHCNNGVGRTGTYILLDMVLNKMVKGAKEIDIAATLEHLRDQRQDMVKTKGQFEFALTAMAEEVTAILSAVPK